MAKVSVIVPVYNVRDYLSGAVESLLRQTERDIEIILVDDGSTDGSGALCDRFAERDKRIKVLHKENGGLSSARNAGAKEASAAYVLFLDGDDYLCDDAVETLALASDRYHPDVVQFLYKEVETTGRQSRHETESWTAFTASEPAALFENLYRLGGVAASGCTKLIKRQLVLDFPFEKIRHEDEMWCTRVFPTGITVLYLPDVLYCYVMREGSIIHAEFHSSKLDAFKVQEERIRVLSDLSLHNLVEREYAKMFLSVLLLYREAFRCGDEHGCSAMKEQFQKNKKAMLRSRYIKGKYKILLMLMTRSFSSVKLFVKQQRLSNAEKAEI
ncbi:MAG: glycosyltransferase family 2 protein [Clostridia bacterium]|nr:glycosyltransferase family 2 protein [Clostridia bacterium]